MVLKWELLSQQQHSLWRDQVLNCGRLVRTNFQPKWFHFGLAVARNLHSKAFTLLLHDHMLKVGTSFAKNTGIYLDFVETANTQDGWYLWCSICMNLNAVLKKCLVISYCPTISSYVYIMYYVLINFWLCYVIKFTWRIQQRWKTFDATVRRAVCPFLTLKKKLGLKNFCKQFQVFWGWIHSLTDHQGADSSINLSKSTKPLSERER